MSTDMPASIGGKGSAPNPGWYLRPAVASYAATVIATRAAKPGITLGQLEVTVESEGDPRGLLRLAERISTAMGGGRKKAAIRGVHGLGARWLVNRSSRGLVTHALSPTQRAHVLGWPVSLRELSVSVADSAGLGAALAPAKH